MAISMVVTSLLPPTVKAFTMLHRNGDFSVYVNEKLDKVDQIRLYIKECQCINNNDLEAFVPIAELEQMLQQAKENKCFRCCGNLGSYQYGGILT